MVRFSAVAAVLCVLATGRPSEAQNADLVGSPGAREDGVVTKSLEERDIVEVVVISPFKEVRANTPKLVKGLDEALRAKTRLRVEAKERDPKLYSGGNFASIVRAVRADVDVNSFAQEEKKDLESYFRDRRAAHEADARYVLVLTVVAQGDKSRVTPTLIDAEEALRALVRFVRDNPSQGGASDDRKDREEEAVSSTAVVARLEPIMLPAQADVEPAELTRSSERAVGNMQSALQQDGVWEQLGGIEVTANVVGAEISIENFPGVEKTVPGVLRFTDVAPGARRVRVSLPGYEPLETVVTVASRDFVRVDAKLTESAGAGQMLRTGTIFGGMAIAAIGAVFLTVGAVATDNAASSCLKTPDAPSNCGGQEWFRFGAPVTADATGNNATPFNHSANGTFAIPPVPFGYSLIGMGGALAAGSAWLGSDDEIPWQSWLIGAGVFTLSYVLSTQLEGRMHSDPEDLTTRPAALRAR